MSSLDYSAHGAPQAAGALGDLNRLRRLARVWIAAASVVYVVDLLRQTRLGLTDGVQRPLGDDFINYWSGAAVALQGHAARAYDFLGFHAFEQSVVGPTLDLYHYSYPPVMLLLTLPLALLPYVPALGLWLIGTWYAFYRALKAASGEGVLLLALATPAVFINAMLGQNGALTAALLGGGLVLLERRPVLAGMLFGLLAFKPHLALMLPVALLAGRQWRALVSSGVTVLMLVAASVIAFGLEPWTDYLRNLPILRVAILEDSTDIWRLMVSVFVFARRFGASLELAYGCQAVSAIIATSVVAWSWWRDHPRHIRYALLIVGTWLAIPYLQHYDLVVGAFVVVWLHTEERRPQAPVAWIRAAMAAVLLLPLVAASIGKNTDLTFGPPLLIPVFALLVRLAVGSDRAQRQAGKAPTFANEPAAN
ncbi:MULTISPECIES: glycosyltransferase family 87 protein [unclassified Bradyrhizobium]|uniref:glycosyltransferase family 87 protein n=1 Tax=unclassified Bradyrhizobium TaxID=2631580 RepID=UPI0028EB9A3B|nr:MULTISPECIES: glycosyltransferase family 87 protein [unclassified Bradyrhizobium]